MQHGEPSSAGIFADLKNDEDHRIFDVKFYPYALPDNDHVFAAVAETDVQAPVRRMSSFHANNCRLLYADPGKVQIRPTTS